MGIFQTTPLHHSSNSRTQHLRYHVVHSRFDILLITGLYLDEKRLDSTSTADWAGIKLVNFAFKWHLLLLQQVFKALNG